MKKKPSIPLLYSDFFKGKKESLLNREDLRGLGSRGHFWTPEEEEFCIKIQESMQISKQK